MKGMPLPFDFQRKGSLLQQDFQQYHHQLFGQDNNNKFITTTTTTTPDYLLNTNFEPTSVLDSAKIITSSSTLSSSHGGGGSTGAASTDTTPKWPHQDPTTATSSNATPTSNNLLLIPPSINPEKFVMEDWESVLSESPSQEQSILRWIMGDNNNNLEDPNSLNKLLHIGAGSTSELDFSSGFGSVDQGFVIGNEQFGVSHHNNNSNSNFSRFGTPSDKLLPNVPLINNPQMLINQNQVHPPTTNPSFYFPLPYPQQQQQHQNVFNPPNPKRHNSGTTNVPDSGFETVWPHQMNHFQNVAVPHQLQLLPHNYMQQERPHKQPKMNDELLLLQQQQQHQPQQRNPNQQQQGIVDQLYKAAELIQTGNLILAQGILARLNHTLSPIGNPFTRAAFYCKEALQHLLLNNNNNNNTNNNSSCINENSTSATLPPFSLIFKIGAYKSFSEISPLVQFANFTCNQALLEVLETFDTIHIVDFDIGYGGQWASLMQELALRNGGPPGLKITVIASSSSTHDQLELGLTRENLIQFASEINVPFEFEVMSVDSLNSNTWSLPLFRVSENEGIAVNLPIGCLANYQLSIPLVLRFVKQLSPRIVVSIDRGCDRTDLPFANHIIHALQSYSNLLESLDAVNVNMDALQKIERFLVQPVFEKIVTSRFGSPEKTQHWRSMFLSSGFTPVTFSNFTESQAECVVKRTPVRGFQVEKRQSSLVLCWQRKELISASAWRC